MSRSNRNRIRPKEEKQNEPLFNRWQNEQYGAILKQLKEEKKTSRKTPMIEGKYDLRFINLKKTRLTDCHISNSCLDAITAYNLYLFNSEISNSITHSGDFEESIIKDSKLVNSKFINTSFKKSTISGTSFSGSIITECNFEDAEIVNIDVEDSIIENTSFLNLKSPELANIIGTPKSMKGSLIDRKSLLLMPPSNFKKSILKDGQLIDNKYKFEFDVALSFAGEDREYVEKVAGHLVNAGVKVFYDNFEKHDLWGKELVTYLTELYEEKCKYVIIFASENYNIKGWPTVERIASLSRILNGEYESILPVKMEEIVIKGLTKSKGYLDSKENTPEEIAEIFIKKLVTQINK